MKTHLEARELARHFGQQCRIETVGSPFHEDFTEGTIKTIDYSVICAVGQGRLEVKPILRPMESITEDECQQLFEIAFDYKPQNKVHCKIDAEEIQIWLNCEYLQISNFFEIKTWDEGPNALFGYVAKEVCCAALTDYLDSIGIDQRGYIAKGWAVDAGALKPVEKA